MPRFAAKYAEGRLAITACLTIKMPISKWGVKVNIIGKLSRRCGLDGEDLNEVMQPDDFGITAFVTQIT